MSTDQMVPDERDASQLSQISSEMVRLYEDQFGRGPTRAPTHWCGDDMLVVLLEDTRTPAERNLVKRGEHERVRESRNLFQYASVRQFCEPVERLTGRTVRAFVSGTGTETDGMSTEAFVLFPPGSAGVSRISAGDHSSDWVRLPHRGRGSKGKGSQLTA